MPVGVLIRLIPDSASRGVLCQGTLQQNSSAIPSNLSSCVTWLSTVDRIRYELGTVSKPQSSGVRQILMTLRDLLQGLGSAERLQRGNITDERTPLLQRDSRDGICAPSVVMVGIIAGGVGGWPQVE